MKVSLELKEDTELRDYIKDMVRGQMKAIIRADAKDMVKQLFEKQIYARAPEVENMIQTEIKAVIRKELSLGNYDNFIRNFAKEQILSEVSKAMKSLP